MRRGGTLSAAFLTCLLLGGAAAQRTGDLDFLSGLEDYRLARGMLPAYLSRLVTARLDERGRAIARLTAPPGVAERRAEVRAQILRAVGGLPERTALNARTVGALERDDYRIEKVIFESQPRFYVTANLYLPKKGRPPYPAVLFPVGHEVAAKASQENQQILGALARKGFVALAWDPIGQGERVQLYDPDLGESKVFRSPTEHTIVGAQCVLVGDNLARYTIHDGMRALDYLLSRPEVDGERIGCTGNSGGGNLTAYLAALDDRIQVAAPSCWLTSWHWLLSTIGPQDAEQTLFPFIGKGIDYADFIHAFAPKPYLVLAATRDFFSINGTRQTHAEAQRIYSLLGAPEKLRLAEADDYHAFSKPRRLAAYRWFSRWLKGVEDQEPEPEVAFATEEELRCVETGQVTTALKSETVFSLNQKRAAELLSRRQPPASREALPAFQTEIRRRARELLNFAATPDPAPVRTYGEIIRPGYRIEKLVYESEAGIIIPSLLLIPETAEARKPAILYVHGRGKAGGAGADGDLEQLVAAGFVVLAIDLRGMGETMVTESQQSNDTRPYFGDFDSAMTALLLGKPLAGLRALDVCRGVDLLAARAEVDGARIYGFGQGGGAVPLLYAAALDERLKRVALEGMLVSYQSIVTRRIHRQVLEQVVAGALKSYDFPDLVAALAPRPVWIINGIDPTGHRVDLAELRKQYAAAATVFRLAGSEASIRIAVRQDHERTTRFYRDWISRN